MADARFLLLYALVIAATLKLCRLALRQSDPTMDLAPPPVPADPDPYEMAYLRGGENEVARTVIFSLVQRGYLQATEEKKSGGEIRRAPDHPSPRHLTAMERSVFGWFATPHAPREVFSDGPLPAWLKVDCAPYEERLRREGLLTPWEVRRASGRIALTGAALVLGLGGYRLAVTLIQGQVMDGFLVLVGLGALVALVFACRPERHSDRGRRYLERLKLAFERLKAQIPQDPSRAADPALLLLVSLFGVGVLSGTAYAYFPRMFHASTASGGSCGGGCGSSGGCSGGGGCGGGCGGCGGCGGS